MRKPKPRSKKVEKMERKMSQPLPTRSEMTLPPASGVMVICRRRLAN